MNLMATLNFQYLQPLHISFNVIMSFPRLCEDETSKAEINAYMCYWQDLLGSWAGLCRLSRLGNQQWYEVVLCVEQVKIGLGKFGRAIQRSLHTTEEC